MAKPISFYRLIPFVCLATLQGCANAPTPVMDFAALTGDGAAIVRLDEHAAAAIKNIPFLDKEVSMWDLTSLNEIVTAKRLEDSRANYYFEVTGYKDGVLARKFQIADTKYLEWVVIIPGANAGLLDAYNDGKRVVVRFDVATGSLQTDEANPNRIICAQPRWDPARKNFVIAVRLLDRRSMNDSYYVARLNPVDLSISEMLPVRDGAPSSLLAFEPESQTVICYGGIGPKAARPFSPRGFFRVSLSTGETTVILEDKMPGEVEIDHNGIALMGNRFAIMPRTGNPYGNGRYTCLADLQTGEWRTITGAYLWWPVSQPGLFFAGNSGPLPPADFHAMPAELIYHQVMVDQPSWVAPAFRGTAAPATTQP